MRVKLYVCRVVWAVLCVFLKRTAATILNCLCLCLQGGTPLHFAAENGHEACVSALVAAEADVNAKKQVGKPQQQLQWLLSDTRLDIYLCWCCGFVVARR